MFSDSSRTFVVRLLLVLLFVSSIASADSRRGRISGTVTDANNAPVSDVKVTIIAKEYPFQRDVYTDKDGKFAAFLPNAPVWCRFQFAAAGFRAVTKDRMVPIWSTDHEVDVLDNPGYTHSAQMSNLNVKLTAQESSVPVRK
jgi:hypothetical protein